MQNNQTEFTCDGILLAVGQIWRLENNAHCVITGIDREGITVEDCTKNGVSFNNPHRRYTTIHNDCVFARAMWCGPDELDFAEFIGTKKENEMQSNKGYFINGHEVKVGDHWKTVDTNDVIMIEGFDPKSSQPILGVHIHSGAKYEYHRNGVFYHGDENKSQYDLSHPVGSWQKLLQDNQSNLISMDKQYKTRDGKNVRVLCVDRKSDAGYTVFALIDDGGTTEDYSCFTADGFYYDDKSEHRYDLIEVKPFVFVPEVGRKYKSRIGETWTILLTNCGDDVYSVVAYKEESGINQIGYFTVKGEFWQDEENNDDMIAYAD